MCHYWKVALGCDEPSVAPVDLGEVLDERWAFQAEVNADQLLFLNSHHLLDAVALKQSPLGSGIVMHNQ